MAVEDDNGAGRGEEPHFIGMRGRWIGHSVTHGYVEPVGPGTTRVVPLSIVKSSSSQIELHTFEEQDPQTSSSRINDRVGNRTHRHERTNCNSYCSSACRAGSHVGVCGSGDADPGYAYDRHYPVPIRIFLRMATAGLPRLSSGGNTGIRATHRSAAATP